MRTNGGGMNRRAFTLLELVLVIVVIGILLVILVPRFAALTQEAKETATRGGLGTIRSVVAIKYAKSLAEGRKAYPSSLVTSDFSEEKIPLNRLNEKSQVRYVTEDVKDPFPQSSAFGWWYNTANGRVGAYSDGKTDVSKW